ncbi:MAG: T9SS type A sorting domain-containing protein [Melioribacteraceae bacterium]
MTNLKILFIIVLISLGSLTAQTFVPQITSKSNNSIVDKTVATSLNILAVMVEFQPDKFNLTIGDGTFGSLYTKEYGNDIIDPLPHDANYFRDHLEFAKNYFEKVSDGNLNVEYTVLPNIITISKVMREYSPADRDGNNIGLGDLAKEVWTKNLTVNTNIDYSKYDVFILFHAGSGKDISTSELLGKSRDLPSLYLGLKTLKNFFGESYDGIDLGNGQKITNTIILPETESREVTGVGTTALLELSINGLIVSSLASHLGLPDLFDSKTGKSAIGRFGLMDGQSLFAYKGLFPPQPSAWEKIFLDWAEPLVVNSNKKNIEVFASEIAKSTDAKIIKVPINSTEYYLIENRARDANNDGIKITYKVAGQIKTLSLPKDTTKFNNINTDTLSGVVLNIDEFDWAVPGSGILIWHIDEKVINQTLNDNEINADKSRRGIDLEEADGIQDIGEEFQTIFGDVIIAEGEEHDLWFANNKSEFYKNKFNGSTKPNTNSNDEAKSLISVSNFSNISNKMSFDVSFGSENIELIKSVKVNFVGHRIDQIKSVKLNDDNLSTFYLNGNNLRLLKRKNNIFFPLLIQKDFTSKNYSVVEHNNNEFAIGGFEKKLNVNSLDKNYTVDIASNISSPIVSIQNNNEVKIYVGMENGKVSIYNFNYEVSPVLVNIFDVASSAIIQVAVENEKIHAISKDGYSNDNNQNIDLRFAPKKIVLTNDQNGNVLSIVLAEENNFYIIEDGEIRTEFTITSETIVTDFSLADIKQDGENYILFYTSNELNAVNINGSMAEGYPIIINDINNFVATPLAADINNDGFSDIISTSDEGVIFAYSGLDGKLLNDFPISTGNKFVGNQTIIKRENDLLLASGTKENELYFWSIKSDGEVNWGSKFGNNQNCSFLKSASGAKSISGFFPKNRTYNWPNPVYESFTKIRTYVAEDSKITIRIFDLSGDAVDILEYNATGGLDNEITWDVSNIQSGAYFARVEVQSNSGKEESKIIKIAVVK